MKKARRATTTRDDDTRYNNKKEDYTSLEIRNNTTQQPNHETETQTQHTVISVT